MADAVDDRTAPVVTSAPSSPQGVVDPVPEVAATAADVEAATAPLYGLSGQLNEGEHVTGTVVGMLNELFVWDGKDTSPPRATRLPMVANPLAPRIDPVAWYPQDPPAMTGALAENRALQDCERVLTADGPEDVAFDDAGRLYTGDESGAIYRTVEPVGPDAVAVEIETVTRTGGRPLAMEFAGEDLLVCAEDAGLVSVSPSGAVETLAARADGRPIAFADDLHVTDDVVYFTDATEHDIFQDELFELRDTGRLLAYDRESGETTVELEGLGFANGVAPGPDGESLLVTETSRYRVTRYWHTGDRAGESTVFHDNLPGYPDNVDVAIDRPGYWLAIPTLRDDTLERLHRYPRVKWLLGVLPKAALQAVEGDPYGLVLRLDESGEVIESLHDPSGEVFGITSATPRDGSLYLGSLFGSAVRRYDLD